MEKGLDRAVKRKSCQSRITGSIITLAIIVLMVAVSEISGEREIIFPEAAAISIGCLVTDHTYWEVSMIRIAEMISAGALLGVVIVLFVPLPLWVQMLLAFAAAQFIIMISGTTFAPVVSAVVLPVLLQTRSIYYLISAVSVTLLIIAVRLILEKAGLRQKDVFVPVRHDFSRDSIAFTVRIIGAAAVIYLSVRSGWKFACAPPLLVAFTEFTAEECRARRKPLTTIAIFALCAAIGAYSRLIITVRYGLPLTLAAAAAALLMLTSVYFLQLKLPPAGAITVLAMLIPVNDVVTFPLQVVSGVSFMIIISILFGLSLKRRMHVKNEKLSG